MEHPRFSELVLSLIAILDDRQRRILELRFGLLDGEPKTLEEVGREFGVTRERIRQIEGKAFRHIRKRENITKLSWAIHSEIGSERRSPIIAYELLRDLLGTGGIVHPDSWMAMLARAFPEYRGFDQPDDEDLSSVLHDLGDVVVYRSEFISKIMSRIMPIEDAHILWDRLRNSESKYYWTDDAAIKRSHAALAYYVIRQAGTPLHWREIHERAEAVATDRDLSATSFYNAIGGSKMFVRTSAGTYGLREWGLKPAPYQKDVIASALAEERGRTLKIEDVIAVLDARGADIPRSSIHWHMLDNPLFYEDLDGNYGLREWLPPPDEQRLDTPRRLRESKRSRERRGPNAGAARDVRR